MTGTQTGTPALVRCVPTMQTRQAAGVRRDPATKVMDDDGSSAAPHRGSGGGKTRVVQAVVDRLRPAGRPAPPRRRRDPTTAQRGASGWACLANLRAARPVLFVHRMAWGCLMDSYLDLFRARAQEARELYEQVLRDRGDREQPSASPTTFSDCASLYEQSALAYRVAAALGSMGYFDQAAASAAQGAVLAEAAESCSASAAGEIIEV